MSVISMSANKQSPRQDERANPARHYTAKARATVERILDAGIALLGETGFDKLSTARVAQRLRISNGNVTYYFPNKRALGEAIADHFVHRFESFHERNMEQLPHDALARFLATIDFDVDDARRGEYRGFLLQVWAAASWNNTAAIMRERIHDGLMRQTLDNLSLLRPELPLEAREQLALLLTSLLNGMQATYAARPELRDSETFAACIPDAAKAISAMYSGR